MTGDPEQQQTNRNSTNLEVVSSVPPTRSSSPSQGAQQPYLSLDPLPEPDFSQLERAPDLHKARAIRAAFFAGPDETPEAGEQPLATSSQPDLEPTYHSRPGGDIVSDIYHFVDQAEQQQQNRKQGNRLMRSVTYAGFPEPAGEDGDFEPPEEGHNWKDIMQPGGFRRNYLQRQGILEDEEDATSRGSFDTGTARPAATSQGPGSQRKHTKSFVDFLVHSSGFTHLYGQDLEEYDEEDDDLPPEISERTALLRAHMAYRDAKNKPEGNGDATVSQGKPRCQLPLTVRRG